MAQSDQLVAVLATGRSRRSQPQLDAAMDQPDTTTDALDRRYPWAAANVD